MMTARRFQSDQILLINDAVAMAEELVSNHYKLSAAQWLRRKYDVRTAAELSPEEIIAGPFAQVIRYEGRKKNADLNSEVFDFYKICLQDLAILEALGQTPSLRLFPFTLYIITHELIHIVRFSRFLQNFDASPLEKLTEEKQVHEDTHQILRRIQVSGISAVLKFYNKWREPLEGMRNS